MATVKTKTVWFCKECGNESSKWMGRCPACGEWNTMVEETVATGKKAAAGTRSVSVPGSSQKPMPLSQIDSTHEQRISLNNGEVVANVTVKFPPKYFNEGAVLKITPVLVFEGGEIAGTPKYVQGENVNDNYTVISWAKGGQYTQTVTFPYDERAKISTLELRTESKCSSKCSSRWKKPPIRCWPVYNFLSWVTIWIFPLWEKPSALKSWTIC